MASNCNATIKTADKRTLKCALAKDHDGPVHEDSAGEAWGDQELPAPPDTSPPPPDTPPVDPA